MATNSLYIGVDFVLKYRLVLKVAEKQNEFL